jgi:exodeoxyribonuclease VII small subunit
MSDPHSSTPDGFQEGVSAMSFEQALGELERLVSVMEGGQLPLDGLLSGYQRGAALLTHCRGRLEQVEAQVKVLDQGELKPWVQS